jgi:hypothetical protein
LVLGPTSADLSEFPLAAMESLASSPRLVEFRMVAKLHQVGKAPREYKPQLDRYAHP